MQIASLKSVGAIFVAAFLILHSQSKVWRKRRPNSKERERDPTQGLR